MRELRKDTCVIITCNCSAVLGLEKYFKRVDNFFLCIDPSNLAYNSQWQIVGNKFVCECTQILGHINDNGIILLKKNLCRMLY